MHTQVLGLLSKCNALATDQLQPAAEEAAKALYDVPLLKSELLQAGLLRTDTLSEMRRLRDEVEEERKAHLHELNRVNAKAAEAAEQSAFQMTLQTSQITNLSTELRLVKEELVEWQVACEQHAHTCSPSLTPHPHHMPSADVRESVDMNAREPVDPARWQSGKIRLANGKDRREQHAAMLATEGKAPSAIINRTVSVNY